MPEQTGRPPLDWREVAQRRAGRGIGDPLIYRQELDSTNTLAATLIPDQAPGGAVVVADHQTAGRGRLQRRWLAASNSGLTCTVVLGPFAPGWAVPMATGLAVVEALAEWGIPAELKWPNDVLIDGRKCAGILIETSTVDTAYWLLVGIGINVCEVDPSLPTATFLDAHVAHPIRREDLLVALLARLDEWYRRAMNDPAAVRGAWQARLSTIGTMISIDTPAGQIRGMASGVAENGALIVRLADGTTQRVQAGDVLPATGRSTQSG